MPDAFVPQQEVVERLLKIVRENPGTTNPSTTGGTDERQCVYQTKDDPMQNCIVGRLARELGWQVPPSFVIAPAWEVADKFQWPIDTPTKQFLSSVQHQADPDGVVWGDLIPWLESWREGTETT